MVKPSTKRTTMELTRMSSLDWSSASRYILRYSSAWKKPSNLFCFVLSNMGFPFDGCLSCGRGDGGSYRVAEPVYFPFARTF